MNETFEVFTTALTVDGELLQIWGQRDRVSVGHLESNLTKFEQIFNRAPPPDQRDLVIGRKCIAFINNKLFRARVCHVVNQIATIQKLDYGDITHVDFRNLRLPVHHDDHVLNLPELAEAFYVGFVAVFQPLDGNKIEILKAGVLHKFFLATVLADYGPNSKIVKFTSDGIDLTRNWFVTTYVGEVSLATQQQIILRRPMVRTPAPPPLGIVAPTSSLDMQQHHPTQAPDRLSSIDPTLIKALAAGIREEIARDNAKAKEQPQAPQFYFSEAIAGNMLHNVMVSHVADGPWSFSVQLAGDIPTLRDLSEKLAMAEKIGLRKPIVVGKPCLGFSKKLQKYCRGVVINLAHDSIRVSLVDYGSMEDLSMKECFELPNHLLATKMLAQPFALAGLNRLKSLGAEDLLEIRSLFNRIVHDQTLTLQATATDDNCVQNCDLFIGTTNVKAIINEKLKTRPVFYTPEPFPAVGSREKVYLSYVDSPRRFFVQLCRREAEINGLQDRVNELGKTAAVMGEADMRPGLPCLAQFPEDQLWYRGKIISISEDYTDVTFVDYGNTLRVVDKTVLKQISNKMVSALPSQALCCCLKADEDVLTNPELLTLLQNSLYEVACDLIVEGVEKSHMFVRLEVEGRDFVSNIKKPEKSVPKEPAYNQQTTSPSTNDNSWGETSPTYPVAKAGSHNTRRRKFNFDVRKAHQAGRNRTNNWRDRSNNDNQNDRGFKKPSSDDNGGGFKKRFDDDGGGGFKKKFDGDSGGGFRKKFDDDNGGGFRKKFDGDSEGGFKKRSDDDSGGGFRKKFDDDSGGGFRKKFDDDSGGGFRKKFDDDSSGGFRKKFDDDSGGGFRKKFDDDSGGGFRKKFDDGDGGGFKKRSDDDSGGGFRKKFDGDSGGGFRKKFDDDDGGGFKKKFDNAEGGGFKRSDDDRPRRVPIRNEERAPPGSSYEYPDLPEATSMTVLPTFFVTPAEFYVQLQQNPEVFQTLMTEMQTDYANKFSIRETEPPQENDIVVAKFSADRVLYRAEVINSSPLTVRFVDYGNTEEIASTRSIFPVMKKLIDMPRQAVKCRLSGVTPVGEDWTGQENAPFQRESLVCTFHSQVDDAFLVSLATSDGTDVAAELVAAGLAAPEGAVKADSTEVSTIVPIAYDLLLGETFSTFVAFIEGVERFFIQINPESVKVMESWISERFSNADNRIAMDTSLIVPGAECISTYDSEVFYRGRVLELTEAGVWVQFYDYGDAWEVPFSQIFAIPDDLSKWPALAAECRIHGDVSGVTDEAQDTFKAANEGMHVVLTVHDVTNNILSVTAYDATGTKLNFQEGVNDSPEQCPLPGLPLTLAETDVISLDFTSPSQILIQLPDTVEPSLDETYASFTESEEVSQGSICAALCQDGHWRRGERISDGEVYLVDVGRNEPVTIVRTLQPELRVVPALVRAVKTSWPFLGSERVSVRRDGEDFVVEPIKKTVFMNVVSSPTVFFVNPSSVSDRLNEVQAALAEITPGEVPETETMVAAKYQEDETWYRALILSRDPLKVKFIDYGNEEEVTEIAPLPEGTVNIPPLSVRLTLPDDVPETAQAILEEAMNAIEPILVVETDRQVDDLIVDGVSIMSKLIGRLTLSVGDVVYVTHAVSPAEFYVQRSQDTELLDELAAQLAGAESFEPETETQEGAVLAAKSVDDDGWYRGRIGDGQVYFLDFGNTAELSDIRKLPSDLAEMIPFALRAALIHPSGEEWTEAANDQFMAYLGGGALTIIEVTFREGIYWLRLTDEGNDIANTLVDSETGEQTAAAAEVLPEENTADINTPSTSSARGDIEWPTHEQTDDDKSLSLNETDEQKRGKMDDCKCDDEKGETILENINLPDSALLAEEEHEDEDVGLAPRPVELDSSIPDEEKSEVLAPVDDVAQELAELSTDDAQGLNSSIPDEEKSEVAQELADNSTEVAQGRVVELDSSIPDEEKSEVLIPDNTDAITNNRVETVDGVVEVELVEEVVTDHVGDENSAQLADQIVNVQGNEHVIDSSAENIEEVSDTSAQSNAEESRDAENNIQVVKKDAENKEKVETVAVTNGVADNSVEEISVDSQVDNSLVESMNSVALDESLDSGHSTQQHVSEAATATTPESNMDSSAEVSSDTSATTPGKVLHGKTPHQAKIVPGSISGEFQFKNP